MSVLNASSHFRQVSDLLLSTQITNRQGALMPLDNGLGRATEMLVAVGAIAGKVLLVGNGGSAAIVSHIHSDLTKGSGIRALVFTEAPLLTALSNDVGYPWAFEHAVQLWAQEGDLLLAMSSSGQSENILRSIRAATALGCHAITFSGFRDDNPLRQMGDLNLYTPSPHYGEVEAAHSVLAHFLTDAVRAARVQVGEIHG